MNNRIRFDSSPCLENRDHSHSFVDLSLFKSRVLLLGSRLECFAKDAISLLLMCVYVISALDLVAKAPSPNSFEGPLHLTLGNRSNVASSIELALSTVWNNRTFLSPIILLSPPVIFVCADASFSLPPGSDRSFYGTKSAQVEMEPFSLLTQPHLPWETYLASRTNFTAIFEFNTTEILRVLENYTWINGSCIQVVIFSVVSPPAIQADVFVFRKEVNSLASHTYMSMWISSWHSNVFSVILLGFLLAYMIILLLSSREAAVSEICVCSLGLATTTFRTFVGFTDAIASLVVSLHDIPTSTNKVDPQAYVDEMIHLLGWMDWDQFVRKVELWLSLLAIARVFSRTRIPISHLVGVFVCVFLSICFIGFLSLGDLGIGLDTLSSVLFCQFGMISSNYPSDVTVTSRSFLFVLWLLINACVVFCALYNFYQASVERAYTPSTWFGLDVGALKYLRIKSRGLMKRIDQLVLSGGPLIRPNALQQLLPRRTWVLLCRWGLLQKCLVTNKGKRAKEPLGERISVSLTNADKVYTWLCLNVRRPEIPHQLTDAKLIAAIDKSFSDIGQSMYGKNMA
jgi:hypothetical protein